MRATGAEIIIGILERLGIETVVGIPGGSNLPLYNALGKSGLRHVLARHEQGAGFIAQGMARSTGEPAVCLATSGPGATNLVTAIADAYADSVPVVAITGQVPMANIGTNAFQEVDACALMGNITKKNYFIRSAHELLTVIPEACAIAKWGRPGPVLIDVPKNVQQEEIEFSRWPEPLSIRQFSFLDEEIDNIADLINRAERPVLYAGGGIISSGASALLARFARKNSIPVVLTLMGLGAFPANDPLYMGMPGMHGTVATNNMLNNADMIIAMGARFDDRAVCHAERFCPKASIIHVDIDQAEIDKIKKSFYSIVCDAGQVLEALEPRIEQNERSRWIEQVTRNKKGTVPCYSEEAGVHDPLHPHNLISRVSSMTGDDTIITTDVGQHQMWVAGAYRFQRPRTFLTSGGLGTMGFGLPAAIGAALANPHKQVICFSGDGSLLMNIQELATLADLQLNVKILVLNNGHLGLVRQQQELFYEGNYVASRFHTGQDFGRSARAFGIRGRSLVNPDDPLQSDDPLQELEQALRQEGPCLIDIPVNPAYNVLPMVPPGQGIDTMIGTEIFPGP